MQMTVKPTDRSAKQGQERCIFTKMLWSSQVAGWLFTLEGSLPVQSHVSEAFSELRTLLRLNKVALRLRAFKVFLTLVSALVLVD